jgi:DNA-binding protein YbaB
MATLQDLLASKSSSPSDFEELLNNFKDIASKSEGKKLANASELNPEDIDAINKDPNKLQEFNEGIKKVSRNPESSDFEMAQGPQSSPLNEKEELLKQFRNLKNSSNVNEAPSQLPEPVPQVKDLPSIQNASTPSVQKDIPTDVEDINLPAKKMSPIVEGNPTSKASFSEAPPVDAEVIPPKFPTMPGGMANVGIPAAALTAQFAKSNIVDPLVNMDQRVQSGEFKMSPQDLTAIGKAGMGNNGNGGPPSKSLPLPTIPSPLLANIPGNAPAPQTNIPTSTTPDNPPMPASVPDVNTAPQQNSIQQLMAALSGGNNSLKDAQNKANENEFNAHLMHGINQIASGLGGVINKGIAPSQVNDKEMYEALLKSATKPVDQEFKQQQLNNALTKTQLMQQYKDAILGKKDAQTEKANGFKQANLDQRVSSQSNREFDSQTKEEVGRLQSVKRVNDLVDAIKSGKLIDSTQVRNILTNDVSQLSLPAGVRGTAADRQKTAINDTNAIINDWASRLESDPKATISPGQLKQIESTLNILKSGYADALHTKAKSLHSGLQPSGQATVANRYKSLAEDYGLNPDINAKSGQLEQPSQNTIPLNPGEIKRLDPKSGRTAIFDQNKNFVRWE